MTADEPRWADGLFEEIDRQVAAGEMDEREAAAMRSMAAFCRQHNVVLVARGTTVVDLWGLGDVSVHFTQIDGSTWWADLDDVARVGGVDAEGVDEFWATETDHDDPDWPLSVGSVEWDAVDGRVIRARYTDHMGALRLFLGWSPWAGELFRNLLPTFERAMVGSGLGDLLVSNQGRTLSDVILSDGPLASEEVARTQAFAGPLAALEREEQA